MRNYKFTKKHSNMTFVKKYIILRKYTEVKMNIETTKCLNFIIIPYFMQTEWYISNAL